MDLTLSPVTEKVWLEATSRCNLRCTYCHLSHEDIPQVDIDFAGFGLLIESMKARKTQELIFNGRGENTFLEGWHAVVRDVLDAGFKVTAVTNLSRVYTEDELAVFSRYASLTVSVDTTKPEIFRSIRRKADIRLVLANIMRIRALAIAQGRTPPEIVWNMIVHDHSMLDMAQSIEEGVATGVDHFHLSVLGETPELPGALTPRQIDRLCCEDFMTGVAQIRRGQQIAERRGRRISMSPGLASLLSNLFDKWRLDRHLAMEITG
jgi:MoaA/NifB/PqqE/SkfB family radical SAM enzyme